MKEPIEGAPPCRTMYDDRDLEDQFDDVEDELMHDQRGRVRRPSQPPGKLKKQTPIQK